MSKVSDAQADVAARRIYEGVRERVGKKLNGAYVMPDFDNRDRELIDRDLFEARAALEAVSSIPEAEPEAWVDPRTISDLQERKRWTTAILTDQSGENASMPLYAHPAPISKGVTVKALIDYLWQEFCELPDRTSPEEYPDMAMLTLKELTAIVETFFERPCLSHTAGEIE